MNRWVYGLKASQNQMFDKSEQDSSVWHRIEKLSKDNYMAAVRLQARAQNEGWSMGNIGPKTLFAVHVDELHTLSLLNKRPNPHL